MAVVTISRELGSRGTRIAEAVAEALDAQCVDKEVLAEMARQAGVNVDVIVQAEERLLSRPTVVSSEMQAFFARRGQRGGPGTMNETEYIQQMSQAIRVLADRDNIVFVGRGAQIILHDHPTALHVHVYAAPETRAARIQRRRSLPDLNAAMRVIQQADEQRRGWYRRFFGGADWKNPRHYHLMVDTGRVPAELAANIIVQVAQAAPPA